MALYHRLLRNILALGASFTCSGVVEATVCVMDSTSSGVYVRSLMYAKRCASRLMSWSVSLTGNLLTVSPIAALRHAIPTNWNLQQHIQKLPSRAHSRHDSRVQFRVSLRAIAEQHDFRKACLAIFSRLHVCDQRLTAIGLLRCVDSSTYPDN